MTDESTRREFLRNASLAGVAIVVSAGTLGIGGCEGEKDPHVCLGATEDADWLPQLTLYVKRVDDTDAHLWAHLWKAFFTTEKFRLIANGVVVCGVPEAEPGAHDTGHKVIWSNDCIEWDDSGCLLIKDEHLARHITNAHDHDAFYISIDSKEGPIGENKLNALCPC